MTAEELGTLRECWECAKFGNLLCDAMQKWTYDVADYVSSLVVQPGFLSTHELWHTRRVRRKKVLAYRGCERDELDAVRRGDRYFGASWTLAQDVAEFFARRSGDKVKPVVATAHIEVDAWLDTPEHELVSTFVDASNVVDVMPVSSFEAIKIDWENRPRLRPMARVVSSADAKSVISQHAPGEVYPAFSGDYGHSDRRIDSRAVIARI